MKFVSQGVLLLSLGAILPGARAQEAPRPAVAIAAAPEAAASYEISGTVRSGKTPLPGVTVSAANTLTGKKFAAVTSAEGQFVLRGLPRGRYVVRIEFMGFAAFTQEVVLNPENLLGKVDAELLLASRQQQQSAGANAALAAMGRGFQSLALDSSLSSMNGGGAANGDLASLPLNGAGADAPTESVSISGAQGQAQDFGGGSEEEMQQRMQEFRERMQREGGGQFGGGPGGREGGGPGMIAMGRMRRGFNINQPHGMLYFSNGNAALDARSYSLTGIPAEKPGYNQARFGTNVGGPLKIPGISDGGGKWFFFAGWNGSRGSAPYDVFSAVPTAAERGGDFSSAAYRNGLPVQIFDPQSGLPYQFNGVLNQMDPALISPAAIALLQYIPLPNTAPTASGQNFHTVTSSASSSDALNLRIVHNFGAGGGPGFGPFGGGGAGGRRGSHNNLNMGMNWSRNSRDIVNPFPSLAGGTGTQGLNASAGWVYGKGRATNMLRFNYNHYHVSTTNLYSNVSDAAGGAGLTGISSDPFDWGLPGISFTSFAGLSDPTARRELDQTYTLSDTLSWNRGKHNLRFGGDYRRILQSFRSSRNAEGTFVFTGFATSQYAPGGTQPLPGTGSDFADFLLGFPQQTSLQFGASSYNFRASAFNLFTQDDWRFRPNLSFNLGLRYEYTGPYTEAQNRIANLDVAAGFSAAAAVLPGQTGPYSGAFPASLVRPDRNNFEPRAGIAWRADKKTVVRTGYGINYNLAQYGALIQNFAFQPPFANTATNVTDAAGLTGGTPLTLVNGFPAAGSTVTNNFAVAPNYRLGYVQIWNLDLQRELRGGVTLSGGYNGAKGTRLDTQRALAIAGGQPFLYESSEGNSILHAATVRVRKRMAHGIGLSAQYVFSKSLDNAASIGGGGSVVAQDPFNISADRGHSSFDQTHKFSGNWSYEIPLGETHRFAQKGFQRKLLSGWQWSGDFSLGSGFYFTPRVLGGAADISRGVSGSLRANVVPGQPLSLGNPTTLEWFNTAAFCAPSAICMNSSGSGYGDAARNSLQGPGQWVISMSMNRTIPIKESRALELRVTASNVFNAVRFTALNTTVNSFTFGEITGTGEMRRITMQARFRF